jgi:hypothetical protein
MLIACVMMCHTGRTDTPRVLLSFGWVSGERAHFLLFSAHPMIPPVPHGFGQWRPSHVSSRHPHTCHRPGGKFILYGGHASAARGVLGHTVASRAGRSDVFCALVGYRRGAAAHPTKSFASYWSVPATVAWTSHILHTPHTHTHTHTHTHYGS